MTEPRAIADWEVKQARVGRVALIEDWSTPLTGSAPRRVRRARLVNDTYSGLYSMERIGGLDAYYTVKLPVTYLQRRGRDGWHTWMTDDPVHWYGMKERVDALPGGHVLCAGLGLGLMVRHLLARPDVSLVEVVEIDADVIELLTPLLPVDPRLLVIHEDYYVHIERLKRYGFIPDAVLWDLAVGEPKDTADDLRRGLVATKVTLGNIPVARFGIRRVEPE